MRSRSAPRKSVSGWRSAPNLRGFSRWFSANSRPLSLAGLIVGLGAAAALSQVLRGRLYGISNFDPITYLAAIAVFLVTVTVAALLPARRALRIDPLRALRHE